MQPVVHVLPSSQQLAEAAARRFMASVQRSCLARGRCTVVLSGGETPRQLYELLSGEPFARSVDWTRIDFFWGDERCVPPDHPDSNYRMAKETLLDRLKVDPQQIHRIRGEYDPPQAASDYEEELRSILGRLSGSAFTSLAHVFDLILLGIGGDGHTASLFPGGQWTFDESSWVRAVAGPDGHGYRITMMPPLLLEANEAMVLATGAAKAEVVQQVIEGSLEVDRYPAQLLRQRVKSTCWFLDRDAASRLRPV